MTGGGSPDAFEITEQFLRGHPEFTGEFLDFGHIGKP
jgi:hypothetical protein